MTYRDRLQRRVASCGSRLCVGIDPRPASHPGGVEEVRELVCRLVEETGPLAAAFKPNIAYFEAMGAAGYRLLEELLPVMRASGALVILDAKRGDIGATQEQYARAYFDLWDVDAVTLNPYMGYDSVEPFLHREGKGVYLLAVTSNPGAADIETRALADGRQVHELVGEMASRSPGETGLVLGLTNATPEVLGRVPDVPLLIPGFGAQGGDLAALAGERRASPCVVNVSRGILYAEPDKPFAIKAQEHANRIASVLG